MGVKLVIRYPNTGEVEFDLPTSEKKKISEKVKRVLKGEEKYLAVDVDDDSVEYIVGTDLLQKSFITITDVSEEKKIKSTKGCSGKLVILGDFLEKNDNIEKSNE